MNMVIADETAAGSREIRRYLDLAARAALRGRGDVEPNPLVGAVIVREPEAGGEGGGGAERIIGVGHHRRFGGAHAEVEALADCRARGEDPRGATMYVTLEPCTHSGKTPPCTDAILAAGIARVVIARRDPNPEARGGAEVLRQAGVRAEFSSASRLAERISDPFVKRMSTGLPWVIVKWAQTLDGRVATRDGDSRWISCETSRRRVHHLRGRVDAIMTADGTIVADNPMLTARGLPRVRRVARRVVINRDLDLVMDFKVITTARETPTTFFCRNAAFRNDQEYREFLLWSGVEVVPLPVTPNSTDLDLAVGLKYLAQTHGVATVLVEAGPGLLQRLFKADLVDEVHVYVAPKLLGDREAYPPVDGLDIRSIGDARRLELIDTRRSGDDVRLVYRTNVPLKR